MFRRDEVNGVGVRFQGVGIRESGVPIVSALRFLRDVLLKIFLYDNWHGVAFLSGEKGSGSPALLTSTFQSPSHAAQ